MNTPQQRLLLPLLCLLILFGCSEPSTPEQQVNKWLDDAETAVENRDTSDFARLVSADYRDDGNRNKQILTRMATGYFLQHQTIHAFTHVQSVYFPEPDLAEVRVAAAVAGTPIYAETLGSVHGSFYQLELRLKKQDDNWLLTHARWQRAGLEAFSED